MGYETGCIFLRCYEAIRTTTIFCLNIVLMITDPDLAEVAAEVV